MSQCERCKCSPNRMFIETAANQEPRYFCPVCVISIAAGYVCKAQMRKMQQARDKARRPRRHTAPEATQ